MEPTTHNLIVAVHNAPARWVLALSGGGAAAVADLLSVPGGSRTLLEIVVPYHEQALAEFLGHRPESFCTIATSQAMARRALARARWLTPGAPVFGLGCTASLVSDRPKRGDHRVHVSTAGRDQLRTWSLLLNKGARDRPGEEGVAARLVLQAIAQTLDLPALAPELLLPGEKIDELTEQTRPRLSLEETGAALIESDGRVCPDATWNPAQPGVLVPGAFNPLHGAHLALATVAERLEGRSAVFELSVANVDKPELNSDEVRRRLGQFVGQAPVWITRAPRFVDKARLFPGAIFAMGADTAARLVEPRYYDDDSRRLEQAFELFRRHDCRFLVASRVNAAGRCLGLEDIPIPEAYRDLFRAIAPQDFRIDVSSTMLRERRPAT